MKPSILLLLAAALPILAAAQQAASPQQLMQEMTGVYKDRFVSAVVVPGKEDAPYPVEDVIEIVPFDKDHIYLRASLHFYNGHHCGIAAIARHEDGAFVYRDREPGPPELPQCVLKVGIENGQLTLSDRVGPESGRTCNKYCGARGSMNYTIGMDKRRPIRYLERLKASRQYGAATKEWQAAKP